MAKSDAVAIFCTGPAGSGKTTFIKLMNELLTPRMQRVGQSVNQVVDYADMSGIMRSFMEEESALGSKLAYNEASMASGKYMPDNLVIETFENWLPNKSGAKILLIGGAPRTERQLELLKHFKKAVVVHTEASKDESGTAILRRMEKGGVRMDDGNQSVFDQRWEEYETLTKPVLGKLNGNSIQLQRSTPLTQRLMMTFEELLKKEHFNGRLFQHGLNCLKTPQHPIHTKIREIENPILI